MSSDISVEKNDDHKIEPTSLEIVVSNPPSTTEGMVTKDDEKYADYLFKLVNNDKEKKSFKANLFKAFNLSLSIELEEKPQEAVTPKKPLGGLFAIKKENSVIIENGSSLIVNPPIASESMDKKPSNIYKITKPRVYLTN